MKRSGRYSPTIWHIGVYGMDVWDGRRDPMLPLLPLSSGIIRGVPRFRQTSPDVRISFMILCGM